MDLFQNLIDINYEKNISITGLTDGFFCAYLQTYIKKYKNDVLIVVPSLYEANKLYSALSKYDVDTLLFPMDDFLTSEALSISPDLKTMRLETLNALTEDNRTEKIVITHLDGYLRFLPTKKDYVDSIIKLKVGDSVDVKELVERLLRIGYKRETLVTTTGEIGIRGYIIDIFPLSENHPVRIEFFGDDIESIRYFDETTQKSIEEISKIEILPNTEDVILKNPDEKHKKLSLVDKKIVNIEDYLNNYVVFYKDINQLKVSYKKMVEDAFNYKKDKDQAFKGEYFLDFEKQINEDAIYCYMLDNYLNNQKISNYER